MTEYLTSFLKNLGCSQCQEFEFHENKENYKNWKLYLKEFEMYSAMILYNSKLKKDISNIININESIILINDNNEPYIKLEYIAKTDDKNNAILVPTDDYQELYQSIEQMEKKFDKEINAYFIGEFELKKIK